MELRKRALVLLILALVFLLPAALRAGDLVEQGVVRAVDLALIWASGLACGALLTTALRRLRE